MNFNKLDFAKRMKGILERSPGKHLFWKKKKIRLNHEAQGLLKYITYLSLYRTNIIENNLNSHPGCKGSDSKESRADKRRM